LLNRNFPCGPQLRLLWVGKEKEQLPFSGAKQVDRKKGRKSVAIDPSCAPSTFKVAFCRGNSAECVDDATAFAQYRKVGALAFMDKHCAWKMEPPPKSHQQVYQTAAARYYHLVACARKHILNPERRFNYRG